MSLGRVLLGEREIQDRVRKLGEEISRDYTGNELLLVGVLKGAFIFLADLARCLTIPVRLDFITVSSYGESLKSSEEVVILKDLGMDLKDRHVLLVEDIIDTGLTIDLLMDNLAGRNPASLKTCALLDKPDRRKVSVKVDYVGFDIPDEYIVGYGLDYQDKYRCLKDIYVLERC
ncbi:MAG TPA: hypoxanthine phosphoribosyltransferase [Desulfotomaculum sp.]|nr:MAG: Hypoxanthine phosphoribosyltransferase [Desulfofundulus kuznetsovii]HAG10753.1 hypoxanthine phosphoribosyltransferase [Desulfotomaculum sp.]HBY03924.1 hypoxanthine phosphoribosyltransferase [Desulfotomaculum sp.]